MQRNEAPIPYLRLSDIVMPDKISKGIQIELSKEDKQIYCSYLFLKDLSNVTTEPSEMNIIQNVSFKLSKVKSDNVTS